MESRWQSRAKPRPRLGRCRDWTGGTYGASYGEGTVQTTNAPKGRRRKSKWQVNPLVAGSSPAGPTRFAMGKWRHWLLSNALLSACPLAYRPIAPGECLPL